jgi:hypothetical protein
MAITYGINIMGSRRHSLHDRIGKQFNLPGA